MPGMNWYYRPVNSSRYPRTPLTDRRRYHSDLNVQGTPCSGSNTPRNKTSGWLDKLKSDEERKEKIEQISRPTMTSRKRTLAPGLGVAFENRTMTWDGHFVWNKMEVLADEYRCLYSRDGALKQGTKI